MLFPTGPEGQRRRLDLEPGDPAPPIPAGPRRACAAHAVGALGPPTLSSLLLSRVTLFSQPRRSLGRCFLAPFPRPALGLAVPSFWSHSGSRNSSPLGCTSGVGGPWRRGDSPSCGDRPPWLQAPAGRTQVGWRRGGLGRGSFPWACCAPSSGRRQPPV